MMIPTEKIDINQVCPMCRSNDVRVTEKTAFVPAKDDIPEFSYMQPKIVCNESDCLAVSLAPEHKQVYHEAFCKVNGLLTPAEIKEIRNKFGASTAKGKIGQRDFAKSLGLGEVTVSRYETGRQIQSRSIDFLIRACLLPGFKAIVEAPVQPKSNVIDEADRFGALIKSNRDARKSFKFGKSGKKKSFG